MKKILSIFFAIVFVFSAFSLNAFAAETTRAEEWAKENFSQIELGARVISIYEDGTEDTITLYIKNEIIASSIPISKNLNIDFILKNGYIYLYFKAFPFFHLKLECGEYDLSIFENPEQIEAYFIKSYETEYNSQKYYVEEFGGADMSVCYWFIEDELKFVKAEGNIDGDFSRTEIEVLTTQVNDEIFELPFYSINIAPALGFIFKSIV